METYTEGNRTSSIRRKDGRARVFMVELVVQPATHGDRASGRRTSARALVYLYVLACCACMHACSAYVPMIRYLVRYRVVVDDDDMMFMIHVDGGVGGSMYSRDGDRRRRE